LNFDEKSLNPSFSYLDDSTKAHHQVWYLDAVTAYDQVAAALPARPKGLALWRLGTEDPSIWSVLGRGRLADGYARNEIKTLHAGYDVLYKGKGEVLSASGTLQQGVRQIAHNPGSNLITGQQIITYPKATTITRWGARSDKVLALTFDDGPGKVHAQDSRRFGGKRRNGDLFHCRFGRGAQHRHSAAHL
jgi:peptidoglycan-N-acetylglucosamine deacetylase